MKILLAMCLLLPSLASAQKAVRFNTVVLRPEKTAAPAEKLNYLLYVGVDARFEHNENMGYDVRTIPALGIGLHKERYLAFLEGGSFENTTITGNIMVRRKLEQISLSGALMNRFEYFAPYVGAGFALARDIGDYAVDGSSANYRSAWEPLAQAFAGVRLFPRSKIWISLEGKFTAGARLDPNPMGGIVTRIGAEF